MDFSEEIFTKTAALVQTFSKFEASFKKVDYYKKVWREFEKTGKLTLDTDESKKTAKSALRETSLNTNANNVPKIKREKISSVYNKENGVSDMPPPAKVPIKKSKQPRIKQEPCNSSPKSRKSQEIIRESKGRPSDVVLQIVAPPLVELDDSLDDDSLGAKISDCSTGSTRSTRATTKTTTKVKDSRRSISSDNQNEGKNITSAKVKRQKIYDEPNKGDESSLYEEACTSLPKQNLEINDATFVLEKPTKPIMNSTMVLEKMSTPVIQKYASSHETIAQSKKESINKGANDLMTDDESPCIDRKTKNVVLKSVKGHHAYNNSPVKKRVEAFEKMAAQMSSTRITRSKRNLPQENKDSERKNGSTFVSQIPTSASKHKLYTPLKSSRDISTKTASALKASQEEVELREARRKENESEALRKRAAIIQAQTEEKKRKREEKLIKAQQAREEAERTKQKNLEEQLRKEEEKYQQAIAEKQEKLKKQKLEAEKKRLLASKKALEQKEKRKEGEKKTLEEQSKPQHVLPIYMTKKAPKLPTDDCYDSDDPEAEHAQIRYPSWSTQANLNRALTNIYYAGHKIKNTLFCLAPQTPKLTDLFQNIDPKKLKRTSSAVWKKPPRFTILPRSELDVTCLN